MALTKFSGEINALEFAYGCSGSTAPALQVIQGSTSTGAYTLLCQPAIFNTSGGAPITINTTTSITIGSDSDFETVTPSAVSTDNLGRLLITATFTYAHGTGAQVSSGTFGLAEALLYASNQGGGTVTVDARWTKAGGTQTILNAATVPGGVAIRDNRLAGGTVQTVILPLTLAQIQAAFTTPIQVVAAPGAGCLVDVIDATLNLVYGSAAYSGGGAAQLSYGTGVTYPATATWAATDFTSLSANQVHKVAGALATTASANALNKAVNYTNATAVFTAGTGGSGTLVVNYKVQSGLA